ncbi:MAG: glycosyltransferase family 4 protein [Candidatus Binataceae bacterium]
MSTGAASSRKLRILIFYETVYPDFIGGLELRNFELARALSMRGHEVSLAGFSASSVAPDPNVRLISLGPRRRLYASSGRRSFAHALRLSWAALRLDLRHYDLVETASMPFAHLLPLAVRCALLGKPLLVTWYEYWGRYWLDYVGAVPGLVLLGLERILAQLGTIALVTSNLTGERLRSARTCRIERLDCGVNLERVTRAAEAARQAPSHDAPSLIFVGRLMEHKRLDLLLWAVAKMPRVPGNSGVLTILGDGPDRDRLVRTTRALGLEDRVRFVRRVETSDEVYAKLAAARAAVQPSAREGFGLFPLEALAAGLPVVYCESPDSAVGELVRDGIEGIRVQADSDALAERLAALLLDEIERARLGANARRRAAQFDWPRIAERFEELGRSAIAGPDQNEPHSIFQ